MLTTYHRIQLFFIAALVSMAAGCVEDRVRPEAEGAHPVGWGDTMHIDDPDFHGSVLATTGYPLDTCAKCHGGDFRGGDVDVSCETSGCHTATVQACGTCHGTFPSDPKPATGAHGKHDLACTTCHIVPTSIMDGGHISGTVELTFGGLATTGGLSPTFDAATAQCGNTYCHGAASPPWTGALPSCGGCHAIPPATHALFSRVADGEASCTTCHPAPGSASHVNGTLEVTVNTCNACHGDSTSAAPPTALDGATAATDPKVGAHQRHLDPSLPGRIGPVVACAKCHQVPAEVQSEGHLDDSAPADVRLPIGGVYDPVAGTCQVWCHFDNSPGPSWSDNSGGQRACDACHGFGPLLTRAGTPHPTVLQPTLAECKTCHPHDAVVHMNGTVDFVY